MKSIFKQQEFLVCLQFMCTDNPISYFLLKSKQKVPLSFLLIGCYTVVFFPTEFAFRVALGWQKNEVEDTEISHTFPPLSTPHTRLYC